MIPPPLVLELDGPGGRSGYLQPLADFELWSDRPISAGAARAPRPTLPPLPPPTPEGEPVHDDFALLEGTLQRVRVERIPEGYRVLFADAETFVVLLASGRIARTGAGLPASAPERTLARALGPPLALALAHRGLYLLHASAVAGEGGALALTAASGGGKSTLAEAALHFRRHRLTRAGDDLLVVRLEPECEVLPAFPQPKLGHPSGYPEAGSGCIPLRALIELVHEPADAEARPGLERLSRPEAFRRIAEATVAARLFDADLLAAHFRACGQAATHLPVLRLRFPSGRERLDESLALLAPLARGPNTLD